MCRSVCVQYVSVLRPPKMVYGNSSRNGDASGPVEGRRRVRSLTNQSFSQAQRSISPWRSLHNLPINSDLSSSLKDELKERRRLAGFDQAYRQIKAPDSDLEPGFGEGAGTHGNEWKHVSDGIFAVSVYVFL